MPAIRKKQSCALLFALAALFPQPAFPWGDEGHRIIAQVAERRLDPGAAQAVRELIGPDGLVEVSTWADQIKQERPESRPWHFVDIPLGRDDYDPARDCARPRPGDCVIGALERSRAVLSDPAADKTAKIEALKFLVHFVGDLHQPLHCIDNGDRGGNEVHVTFFGEATNRFSQKPWNLHAVWDAGLIARAGLTQDQYVSRLEGLLKTRNQTRLVQGGFREWALESHRAAERLAYKLLPADRIIGENYYRQALPTVDAMLARAGARLARILNDTLGPRPRPAEKLFRPSGSRAFPPFHPAPESPWHSHRIPSASG